MKDKLAKIEKDKKSLRKEETSDDDSDDEIEIEKDSVAVPQVSVEAPIPESAPEAQSSTDIQFIIPAIGEGVGLAQI